MVQRKSRLSNFPPLSLSLYSIPNASPATKRMVKINPNGIAYRKCFSLLLVDRSGTFLSSASVLSKTFTAKSFLEF